MLSSSAGDEDTGHLCYELACPCWSLAENGIIHYHWHLEICAETNMDLSSSCPGQGGLPGGRLLQDPDKSKACFCSLTIFCLWESINGQCLLALRVVSRTKTCSVGCSAWCSPLVSYF